VVTEDEISMPRTQARNVRLGPRDHDIFEHVRRYRLTTREVLHRLFFPEVKPNAVTKVTSRLCDGGFLRRFDLYESRDYFVLGPEAARILGVPQKRTEELGVQARPIEYATLLFCTGAGDRERLTRDELKAHHPSILVPGVDSSHYYLDRDGGKTRLASIRVDCGGPPDHVARKCRDDLDRRLEHDAFKDLIANDQFMIAILTGREEKASAIHETLKRHPWPNRFRLSVIPELVHLVTRLERG
jgi:hypothetical protein